MKSKSIKIAALSLACISTLSLATSCGDSGKTKLKIIALEASYGITWIEELEKEFEKLHPEIDVDLTTSYSAGSLIESAINLQSSNGFIPNFLAFFKQTFVAKSPCDLSLEAVTSTSESKVKLFLAKASTIICLI